MSFRVVPGSGLCLAPLPKTASLFSKLKVCPKHIRGRHGGSNGYLILVNWDWHPDCLVMHTKQYCADEFSEPRAVREIVHTYIVSHLNGASNVCFDKHEPWVMDVHYTDDGHFSEIFFWENSC